jgi:hypothetical protein
VTDVVEGTVEGDEPEEEQAAPHVPAVAPAQPVAQRRSPGELVTSQAAAVAATGFAVGAVTAVALSRRRTKKAVARKSAKGGTRREVAKNVVASRSFLVDVHLLAPKD